MRGKNKCKILRQIRQRIAEENDIPLITKECTYQGECTGTCPRCESELRYLEQQLSRRRSLGKAVTVAALSVSLMVGAAGCSAGGGELEGDVPYISAPETVDNSTDETPGAPLPLPDSGSCDTSTSIDPTGKTDWDSLVVGELPANTEETVIELEGDVAYIPSPGDTAFSGASPTPGNEELPEFEESPAESSEEVGNG